MRKNYVLLLSFIFVSTIHSYSQSWNITGNSNATATSILGTTNAFPLNLTTNNLKRMVIDVNGRVGIGTATPVNIFSVKGAGSNPATNWVSAGAPIFTGFGENTPGNADFVLSMASNVAGARGVVLGRRARGTLAAPSAVAINDQLTSFLSSGYDGGSFQNAASLDFFVDGAPTAGNVPTRISLVTGTNGGNRTERLKIGATGNFDFNSGQLTLQRSTGHLGLGMGNINFANAMQTIQFPEVTSTTSMPMMNMFSGGTQNKARMVIGHSPDYPNWGLQYVDSIDNFNFLSGGMPVLSAALGYQTVGVGTTAPYLGKLVVEGAIGNTTAVFRGSSTGKGLSLVSDYPGIYFNSYWNGGQKAMSSGYAGILNFDPVLGNIIFSTSPTQSANAGDAVATNNNVTIDKFGNMGVGTTTPTARLFVSGDTVTTPVISAVTNYVGNSDVRGIKSFSKPADGWGYGVEGTGGFIGGIFTASSGAYTGTGFGVYGTASGTAGTRIGVYGTASGGTVQNWGGYFPTKTYTNELRVGGEKGAAGYVAAINGKLIATELRVEAIANWPDYVFGKNYKLLPLEELEQKINVDKHLPGIPAAAEVEEKGIMVGEMQRKTIEKVEELTLYLIQLSKENKELKARIEKLEKK